jgi:hypothetical protein
MLAFLWVTRRWELERSEAQDSAIALRGYGVGCRADSLREHGYVSAFDRSACLCAAQLSEDPLCPSLPSTVDLGRTSSPALLTCPAKEPGQWQPRAVVSAKQPEAIDLEPWTEEQARRWREAR